MRTSRRVPRARLQKHLAEALQVLIVPCQSDDQNRNPPSNAASHSPPAFPSLSLLFIENRLGLSCPILELTLAVRPLAPNFGCTVFVPGVHSSRIRSRPEPSRSSSQTSALGTAFWICRHIYESHLAFPGWWCENRTHIDISFAELGVFAEAMMICFPTVSSAVSWKVTDLPKTVAVMVDEPGTTLKLKLSFLYRLQASSLAKRLRPTTPAPAP